MRTTCTLGILVVAGCSVDPAAAPEGPARDVRPGHGPVVLELFTSQGCSSCPPADAYLASLRRGDVVAGREVIPLSFHVDYWNDLGWVDPYATAAWSDRQAAYAARGVGRVYTPELVIAGRTDAIGSRRADVEARIAAAPDTTLLVGAVDDDGDALAITATIPAGATGWAAIVEDGLDTAVPSGENAGARLRDDHLVRALVPLRDGEARIARDPAWGRVHAVVLAVDDAGAIVGARAL